MLSGASHKHLRFGTGNQNVRRNAETAAAELLETGNVLQRFAGKKPPQTFLQLRRDLGLGPHDIVERRKTAKIPGKTQNEAPCLLRRIQSLKRSGALPYKLREQHYEFSIIELSKAVKSKPAVRIILGTREALVIPGIVLISRKYKPSSARI